MPAISIIVPIYKVESYINRCIESIINQDYRDIEIILVDDGSPDKCPQICDDYAAVDKRIKVIHKENGGLSDARNYGITNSEGEYVIFVDSDDYIEVDTCSNFIATIKDENPDIVVGNGSIYDGGNIRSMSHNYDTKGKCVTGIDYLTTELKGKSMHMAAWLNMYRKKFLIDNNLQFKIGLLHEDEQFTPRAFLFAKKVIGTNFIFYNYIIRDNSITTQKDKLKNAECIVEICKELEVIYDRLKDSELKYLLKEHLVNIYLNSFHVSKLYKRNVKHLVDLDFLSRNACSKRNKYRIMLLKVSKRLYYTTYALNRMLTN